MTDKTTCGESGTEHWGELSLPITRTDMLSFLSDLLGRPQEIGRSYDWPFEIDLNGLLNIHHLLSQRVSQQNSGGLAAFTASVYFDDGSHIVLGSAEELSTFSEVRALVSVGTTLCWVFLLQFPGKNHPERQEVRVSFGTTYGTRSQMELASGTSLPRHSQVGVNIRYTARTWAEDVANLLSGHLEQYRRQVSKPREILRSYHGYVSFGLAILMFVGPIVGGLFVTYRVAAAKELELAAQQQRLSNVVLERMPAQLDYLTALVVDGDWARHFFIFSLIGLVSFGMAFFVFFYALIALPGSTSSFVVLTTKAISNRDERKKREAGDFWSLFKILAFDLGVNLTASVMFYLATG